MHKIGIYNFLSKKDNQIEESNHLGINDHHIENKSECKYLDSILDLNLWFQLQVNFFKPNWLEAWRPNIQLGINFLHYPI